MSQAALARRVSAGAVTVAVVVTGLAAGVVAGPAFDAAAGTAPPAYADAEVVRRDLTGPSGPQQVKSTTVECPDDTYVFGAGGVVNYDTGAAGGVALTGIVPNAGRTSVTVMAAAPASRDGHWSLTAHVVCDAAGPPVPVAVTGMGTATAGCPGAGQVFGMGFRVEGGPLGAHVAEVAADVDLRRLRVTATGPAADSVEVTAIALCWVAQNVQPAFAHSEGHGWPKVAQGWDTDPELDVYWAGAWVDGPTAATLDAIVPGGPGEATWARGTLLHGTGGPGAPERRPGAAAPARGDVTAGGGAGDGDGSVTVEAVLIGTFH